MKTPKSNAKNTEPTTKQRTPRKKVPEKREFFFFKEIPVSDDYLSILAQEYATWACDNHEAYKASEFRTLKKIPGSTWMSWLERNENLMTAHLFVLEVIGNRREIGALTKKLDSSIVSFTMPHYDSEWKQLVEWRSSLREKEKKQEASNFVIQMDSFLANDSKEKSTPKE